MAVLTVLRTSIVNILPLAKSRLITLGAMVEDRIFIVGREETEEQVPYAQGDNDLVLKLTGIMVEQAFVEGGGRTDTRIRRQLRVTIRSRLGVDESTRDYQFLTDAQLGHYQIEDKVFNALQLWDGSDSAGNLLLVTPAKLVGGSDTIKPKAEEWGTSRLDFDLYYEQALDQAVQ